MQIVDDLPKDVLDCDICAIDTETNGLDFRSSRPLVFQYYSAVGSYIVPLRDELPKNVRLLLKRLEITKIAHYAEFDFSHLYYTFKCLPVDENEKSNIRCTWVAARMLDPMKTWGNHKLTNLLQSFLGIILTKNPETQISDWSGELTPEQLAYAQDDVMYLIPLYQKMLQELTDKGIAEQYREMCELVPLKVKLAASTSYDPFPFIHRLG